jgi:hypothetical protein
VLGELERPVVRREVRTWRTTGSGAAGLREAAVVVTAVAGEEGTRPLMAVKVDPAVATVRDIKKGVEQAWGSTPPEEQQLYRQPKAGGGGAGMHDGSSAERGQQGTRKRRPAPRFSFLKRCFLLRPGLCGKTACFSI